MQHYDAMILCDENCIMNEAFMSAQLELLPPENPLLLEGRLEPNLIQPMTPVHTFQDAMTGTLMTMNNCFAVLTLEEPELLVSESTIQVEPRFSSVLTAGSILLLDKKDQ